MRQHSVKQLNCSFLKTKVARPQLLTQGADVEAAGESLLWGSGAAGVCVCGGVRGWGAGGVSAVLSVSVQQAAADGKHEARWPLAPALTLLTWRDLS